MIYFAKELDKKKEMKIAPICCSLLIKKNSFDKKNNLLK
jgi:hypothetical protein